VSMDEKKQLDDRMCTKQCILFRTAQGRGS
jgi:hypothetical protein